MPGIEMSPLVLSIIGLVLLALGVFLVIISLRNSSGGRMKSRLDEYVSERNVPDNVRGSILEIRQLEGTISERVISPAIKRIGAFLGRFTPQEAIASLNKLLSLANNPFGMTAREFYGLRIVVLLLFSLPPLFFFSGARRSFELLMIFLFPVTGYLLPMAWLKSRAQNTQSDVLRALPDTLDMLSVCTAAGLGFDQSMQRISEYYDNPLGEEFGRVISELEVGVTRQDSLRNMADRLEVPELSSFVSIILQSEQLGMSISDTLKAQAEQMRILRRFRAQEIAQRIPAKMLFPLAFLILPALLAVILGPSIPAFVDMFGNF